MTFHCMRFVSKTVRIAIFQIVLFTQTNTTNLFPNLPCHGLFYTKPSSIHAPSIAKCSLVDSLIAIPHNLVIAPTKTTTTTTNRVSSPCVFGRGTPKVCMSQLVAIVLHICLLNLMLQYIEYCNIRLPKQVSSGAQNRRRRRKRQRHHQRSCWWQWWWWWCFPAGPIYVLCVAFDFRPSVGAE